MCIVVKEKKNKYIIYKNEKKNSNNYRNGEKLHENWLIIWAHENVEKWIWKWKIVHARLAEVKKKSCEMKSTIKNYKYKKKTHTFYEINCYDSFHLFLIKKVKKKK